MPYPHAYPPDIRDLIIERVAAGETVKGICAEAGMPDAASVQVWRRADPAFAARLAWAREQARAGRRDIRAFDETVAAAFVQRVAEGRRTADVLRDPDMPSQRTFAYWRRTQEEFAEALWRVKNAKADVRAARWYRRFDAAVADKIIVRLARGEALRPLLRSDRAFPSRAVFYRWREENRDWAAGLRVALKVGRLARERAEGMLTPALQGEITGRIVEGASLRSLAAEPGMPAYRTLVSWIAKRPEFARAVAAACEDRDEWYTDHILMAGEAVAALGVRAMDRAASPWVKQQARLRHRPGRKLSM